MSRPKTTSRTPPTMLMLTYPRTTGAIAHLIDTLVCAATCCNLLQLGRAVSPSTLAAVCMAVGRSDLRGALDLFDRFSPILPPVESGVEAIRGHKLMYIALLEVTALHCRLDAARVILSRMQVCVCERESVYVRLFCARKCVCVSKHPFAHAGRSEGGAVLRRACHHVHRRSSQQRPARCPGLLGECE